MKRRGATLDSGNGMQQPVAYDVRPLSTMLRKGARADRRARHGARSAWACGTRANLIVAAIVVALFRPGTLAAQAAIGATPTETSPSVASPSAGARMVRTIGATRLSTPIVLDGIVDSAEWAGVARSGNFVQYFPFDTAPAKAPVEFMIAYDENTLYVGAVLHEYRHGGYVSASLRRDYRGSANDGVTLVLDPWRDGTTGVFFGVNPYNVQREGLVVNGGVSGDDFDRSWDNVWSSATYRGDGYWSVEMAIPFKALRFNAGDKTWGVNFYRIDSKANERTTWSPIPRQFQVYSLAYLGELQWDTPVTARSGGFTLIPYAAGGARRQFETGLARQSDGDVGLDAKVMVTPSLNLDLTVNPDFSQVEVDEQQTNLDRFELFFPERRQFFLENADLFAGFGFDNARPFFSRRIGIAIDSSTGQNVQNRIIGGARLSGRLSDDWRIGVMSMQAASDVAIGVGARNYAVAAVQRQLFARSNLALIAVNEQNTDGGPLDPRRPDGVSASRMLGVDYNLASADGVWFGKFFHHQQVSDGAGTDAYSHGVSIQRNERLWRAKWEHQVIGDGFDARTGYVPRRGFQRINPELEISKFPAGTPVNRHVLRLDGNLTWDDPWGLTDRTLSARYAAEFRNTGQFNVTARSRYTQLFAPFRPVRGTGLAFAAGERFEQPEVEASITTDPREVISGTLRVRGGKYFNGSLRQTSGSLNYRWRQFATGALTWNVSQVDLAPGFDDATLWLLGSRIDVTFTTTLFWTTFTQYNSQFDNLNVNSRLQWRFLPASDLFLVYTDNYVPDGLRPKNRALLAKVSWWVNL